MRGICARFAMIALIGAGLGNLSTLAHAEVGFVMVTFRKSAIVLGVGRGEGTLEYRRERYPFTITGMSVGATAGMSSAELTGRAYNLKGPESLEGTYTAIGGGAALAGGVGAVYLQNKKGVVLRLNGPKLGIELSIALARVRIRMNDGD